MHDYIGVLYKKSKNEGKQDFSFLGIRVTVTPAVFLSALRIIYSPRVVHNLPSLLLLFSSFFFFALSNATTSNPLQLICCWIGRQKPSKSCQEGVKCMHVTKEQFYWFNAFCLFLIAV